jgi:hypothetical protein
MITCRVGLPAAIEFEGHLDPRSDSFASSEKKHLGSDMDINRVRSDAALVPDTARHLG